MKRVGNTFSVLKRLTDVFQQIEPVSSCSVFLALFDFEDEDDEDQNLDDGTNQEKVKKTKRRHSSVDDARVQVTTK